MKILINDIRLRYVFLQEFNVKNYMNKYRF